MKIKLDPGSFLPERAHSTDAGLDLRAIKGCTIKAGCNVIFDTGVHVELPPGTAGIVVSKSGLNVNHDITSTGLIDEGYTGSIKIKLYNHGAHDYVVKSGDKISQLVIVKVEKPEINIVQFLDDTERGEGGFGSTGR